MNGLDGDVGEARVAGPWEQGRRLAFWSSLGRILRDQIETELLWPIDRWTGSVRGRVRMIFVALSPNARQCTCACVKGRR
jgi:hypothetical protein